MLICCIKEQLYGDKMHKPLTIKNDNVEDGIHSFGVFIYKKIDELGIDFKQFYARLSFSKYDVEIGERRFRNILSGEANISWKELAAILNVAQSTPEEFFQFLDELVPHRPKEDQMKW